MIILPQQVAEALDIIEKSGFEAYVVGECVREMILGRSPQDFDIVTNAEINDILFAFRNYRISDEGMQRGEIMVTILGMVIAISPYRREVVGNRVMYAEDLDTDLARRGFTMNAMAFNPKIGLIDPYDGKNALVGGEVKKVVAIGENVNITTKSHGVPTVQTVYDMTRSFSICPSRLLEAIRYCSEDEYEIDQQTRNCMRSNLACFDYADADSIREELQRIVMGKFAARALADNADILQYILPEIIPCVGCDQCSPHHEFDVWTHICKAVGYSLPEPSIRFAMLFHDLGKPDCMSLDKNARGHFKGHGERSRLLAEGIMRRLNFPKNLSDEISWLVFHHDVKIPDDRRGLKALIRELGAPDLKDLLRCEIADSRARTSDSEPQQTVKLRKALSDLNEIIDTKECYEINQLAVTRRELLERNLARNEVEADQLLNALFDIVLDKPSFNNRLMLIDIAEKSKSKLKQIEDDKRRIEEERAEREREKRTKGRRSEPIFTRRKPK